MCGNGSVAALDVATGDAQWTIEKPWALARGVFDATAGQAYMGYHCGDVVAFDPVTGATRWAKTWSERAPETIRSSSLVEHVRPASPALRPVCSLVPGKLARQPVELITTPASPGASTTERRYAAPRVSMQEGVLYIAAGQAVRALNADGLPVWTYHVAAASGAITVGPVVARPPSRSGEPPLVVFGTADGALHAVQAHVCFIAHAR